MQIIVTLNAIMIMLNVFMVSVIMSNVIILNVVSPHKSNKK